MTQPSNNTSIHDVMPDFVKEVVSDKQPAHCLQRASTMKTVGVVMFIIGLVGVACAAYGLCAAHPDKAAQGLLLAGGVVYIIIAGVGIYLFYKKYFKDPDYAQKMLTRDLYKQQVLARDTFKKDKLYELLLDHPHFVEMMKAGVIKQDIFYNNEGALSRLVKHKNFNDWLDKGVIKQEMVEKALLKAMIDADARVKAAGRRDKEGIRAREKEVEAFIEKFGITFIHTVFSSNISTLLTSQGDTAENGHSDTIRDFFGLTEKSKKDEITKKFSPLSLESVCLLVLWPMG